MKYARAVCQFIWKWVFVFPARINIFWGHGADKYWAEHYGPDADPSLRGWNKQQRGKML
jgi:hypothetical protein